MHLNPMLVDCSISVQINANTNNNNNNALVHAANHRSNSTSQSVCCANTTFDAIHRSHSLCVNAKTNAKQARKIRLRKNNNFTTLIRINVCNVATRYTQSKNHQCNITPDANYSRCE